MQVKTIQEVFDWTVQFHTQMAANFFSVRELMGERNVALADYCVDYEKKLAEDLIGFKAISEINTLNTYCYEYFLENTETKILMHKRFKNTYLRSIKKCWMFIVTYRIRLNRPRRKKS